MFAPQPTTVQPVKQLFRKLDTLAPERRLKVAVWGEPEVGKTHFALTFPEPVFVIDTESGTIPLAKKFKKEIYIYECREEKFVEENGKKTLRLDPIECLENIDVAITQMLETIDKTGNGTFVIDSATDLWNWCEAYMKEKIGEIGRKMLQWDWKYANDKWKETIMKLIHKPVNVVLTAQTRPVYEGPNPTGLTEPRWMRQTPYWFDIIVRMEKRPVISDGRPARVVGTKYIGVIEKCRAERMSNREIEDITYDKLVETLKPYLWWL